MFRELAARLRVEPRQGHQVQGGDAAITIATLFGTVWLYIVIPKGFFPSEDTGFIFVSTEAQADMSFQALSEMQAQGGCDHPGRPLRSIPQLDHRSGRSVSDREHRPHLRRAQVARRAPGWRQRGHRPAACGDGQRGARPRRALPRRAEPQHRRASVPGRISIHDDLERHRYALSCRARDAGQDRRTGDGARRQHRPRSSQSADEHRDRPREGGGLRHLHRSGAPGAVQRLRLAPGGDHLHAGRRLSGDPGEQAGIPEPTSRRCRASI